MITVISILFALLSFLIGPVIIVLIVLAVVRRSSRHGAEGHQGTGANMPLSHLTPRQAVLGLLFATAAYAGIAGIYVLPNWLLGFNTEGQIFGVQLVGGLIVLAAGIALMHRRFVGALLMTVGVISMFVASPYVFSSLGSVGVLLVIFLVFVSLIVLAIRFSHKEHTA